MGEVTARGPLFEGDPETVMSEGIRRANKRIADRLLDEWRGLLNSRIRVNTGRYVSSLTASEGGEDTWYVHDDVEIEYGPWLEGKGSRNHTTRFPGYHSLQEAEATVSAIAGDIVEEEVHKIVEELNG